MVIRGSLRGPELLGPARGAPFWTAGPLRVLSAVRDDGMVGTLREVQLANGAVGLVHERTLARALPRRAPKKIAHPQMVAGRPSEGF